MRSVRPASNDATRGIAANVAPDMTGRVCVVTGATRGIGRPTAAALAALGASVIVHGRDAAAVDRVRDEIESATGNPHVSGVVGSFDRLAEVRDVAARIRETHEHVHVLVNNAGTGAARRRVTEDGHEWQFGVNHLAPFLLTNLLLDRIVASAPARIVNVASAAHRRAALDLDDPDWTQRRFNGIQAYSDSKLANILFTRTLARRLAGTGVTANALHPGVVATNIFRNLGVLGRLFDLVARPWLLSANDGARTSIHLAASPDVTGISGEYFDRCATAATTAAARDDALAERLWQISAAMTGIAGRTR